jgi:hypothetical protein
MVFTIVVALAYKIQSLVYFSLYKMNFYMYLEIQQVASNVQTHQCTELCLRARKCFFKRGKTNCSHAGAGKMDTTSLCRHA